MVFFITGLGMILYWNGDKIRQNTAQPASFKLEFSGAIIATVFSVGSFFERAKEDILHADMRIHVYRYKYA